MYTRNTFYIQMTQTRDLAQFLCKKSIEATLKKISHLSIPPNGCPQSKCILLHTNILYNCATVFFRSMVLRVTVWLLKIPPKWLEISVKDWGKWEPKRAKLLECFFQIVLNFRYCLVVPPMLVRKHNSVPSITVKSKNCTNSTANH